MVLMLKGYQIVAHRFKTHVGEIDLIAKRGNTLCFVEVKKRARLADALDAITPHQQKRWLRSAEVYLKLHAFSGITRFDCIVMGSWGYPRHIENVMMHL